MHPYYKKNEKKLKKQLQDFLFPVSKELEEVSGKEYPFILEEIWDIYLNDMMEYFPYVGGDKAGGTRNLTGACVYIAMGEVCRKYGVTMEKWGYLTTLSYRRYFEKLPDLMLNIPKHLLSFSGFTNKMLRKKDRANEKNNALNPGSFLTEVKGPCKDFPIVFYIKSCPIADFTKKHGYAQYMPYICNLDYVMFEAFKIPFYRENTLASGDDFCDYRFSKDLHLVPSWPLCKNDKSFRLK